MRHIAINIVLYAFVLFSLTVYLFLCVLGGVGLGELLSIRETYSLMGTGGLIFGAVSILLSGLIFDFVLHRILYFLTAKETQ